MDKSLLIMDCCFLILDIACFVYFSFDFDKNWWEESKQLFWANVCLRIITFMLIINQCAMIIKDMNING